MDLSTCACTAASARDEQRSLGSITAQHCSGENRQKKMRAVLQTVSLLPAVPKGRERRKQNGVPSKNPFVLCFLRK